MLHCIAWLCCMDCRPASRLAHWQQLLHCIAGNSPTDVQPYETGKAIAFMLLIGFTGIFSVTALRKIFIIDYKLAYPSGTATGVLINSLHTPAGEARVSSCSFETLSTVSWALRCAKKNVVDLCCASAKSVDGIPLSYERRKIREGNWGEKGFVLLSIKPGLWCAASSVAIATAMKLQVSCSGQRHICQHKSTVHRLCISSLGCASLACAVLCISDVQSLCVYASACMCACVYSCVLICMYMCTQLYVCVYSSGCVFVWSYLCVCVCQWADVCMFKCRPWSRWSLWASTSQPVSCSASSSGSSALRMMLDSALVSHFYSTRVYNIICTTHLSHCCCMTSKPHSCITVDLFAEHSLLTSVWHAQLPAADVLDTYNEMCYSHTFMYPYMFHIPTMLSR